MLQRGDRLTPIIKADANARSIAVVTLVFDPRSPRPTVSHRLQAIDTHIPKQPATEALVRRWVTSAFDAFRKDGFEPDRLVGRVTGPPDGRGSVVRNQPGALTELVPGYRARGRHADVGIVSGSSVGTTTWCRPVRSLGDTIRMLPFGGKVLRSMDGALLASVLDAGVANQGTGGFLHLRGAMKAGATWQIAGRPLDPAARYVVAMPEFLMTGLEGRLGFLTRTNFQVRDVQELRDIRFTLMAELRAR
jgi:5'-nucleotidase